MAFRELAVGAQLGAARGDVVVCVPLFGGHEHFVRCLRSLLAHTPADVPILVADDCSPEPASRAWVERLDRDGVLEHELTWAVRERNAGFVENVNDAFAMAAPADVLLVNSDVVVAEGWIEGIRDAAYCDTTVATATPLTNHGTLVSVPIRNTSLPALPSGLQLDEVAARIRTASLRLRPRLPVAIGHCVYVRRSALELVGSFDLAFSPGYGEEVDFSQRCLQMGLQHVAADDVLVAHHGSGSFSANVKRAEIQLEHEGLVNLRYPYYPGMVMAAAADETSPLARALGVAVREILGLRITIDGRALGPTMTGTQVHILELVAALDRSGAARVRVLVPDDLGEQAAAALGSLARVELLSIAHAEFGGAPRDDVVHRPWQVSDLGDVALLAQLGERLVVTQQDLIAYRNPSYFPDAVQWLEYRKVASEVMAISAMTLFFSEHARADTLAEDLLEPDRARVVLIGTDHRVTAAQVEPRAPARVPVDKPFLLCLGTDFRHKNRLFALRLLDALQARHGWSGRLVLAGPNVAAGSSSADEAAYLTARPGLAPSVIDVGTVDEHEKAWLMERCAAVVYPTTYEGFGLVPFEAAAAGAACFFAHQSSLRELVPEEAALIVPWDPDATSDAVIGVLTDPEIRATQVARVRDSGALVDWDTTGAALLTAYRDAMRLPARSAVRIRRESLVADARYWALRNDIGGTGLSLVEPSRALLPGDAQRALAALSRRRATRGLVVAPLGTLARTVTRWRALKRRVRGGGR